MHWGHAVSKDLVHWQELPIALYPHRSGDWCFSGSALVDWNNTAGFQTGDEKNIVAVYTSTGRGESIAYSNDRGRTFTDFEGNPVVKHRGRDPKVIWYEPAKHWVMAVYDEAKLDGQDKRCIAFHTSFNLRQWEFQSRIEGYYECPEIFELPVDGDKSHRRWVIYAADGAYAVGSFDGKKFFPDHEGKHRFSFGNSFYASQTFNDIPPEDGRRIQVAWGRIGHPSMPFNQMMLFPIELTLRTTDQGIRLFANPVKDVGLLDRKEHAWKEQTLKEGENLLSGISGDLFHIRAEFEVGTASEIGFNIRGIPVVYNSQKQELSSKGGAAPLKPENGRVHLELLVDRTSIEIFANQGRVYMPIGVIPMDENHSLEVFAKGGSARLASLEVFELKSAWE